MSDVRLTATNPEDSSVVPVACNAKGELKLEEPIAPEFDGDLDGDLTVSGSGTFAGAVSLNTGNASTGTQLSINKAGGGLGAYFYNDNTSTQLYLNKANGAAGITFQGSNGSASFEGSVSFSGLGAGFTAEGYLWCKTRRGNIVILEDTTNGVGMWSDYTPPTRAEQVKERIDAFKEAKAEERDESDNSH